MKSKRMREWNAVSRPRWATAIRKWVNRPKRMMKVWEGNAKWTVNWPHSNLAPRSRAYANERRDVSTRCFEWNILVSSGRPCLQSSISSQHLQRSSSTTGLTKYFPISRPLSPYIPPTIPPPTPPGQKMSCELFHHVIGPQGVKKEGRRRRRKGWRKKERGGNN